MSQTMLKLRAEISKRRPAFPRNKSGHRMNLRVSSWRKPKGKHTKLRLHKGSRLPLVKDGFRGPAVVRGVHNSGLQMVLVHNMPQLLALKAGEHTAIIADVGQRKKYDLVKKEKSRAEILKEQQAKADLSKPKLRDAGEKK